MKFTRQTHNTSYIAYEAKPSKPVSVKVGDRMEAMQVHPEGYVREFTSIKVARINEARADNQRTPSLHIELDASSIVLESGKTMRENFGGSIQAGGELEKAFRHAHNNDIALYVAIETKRKWKSRGTDQVISYLTPINELRGATPDGKGTDTSSGLTRANCSNVIVAVGPAADPDKTFLSPEAVTDPTKWDLVRSNRDGTLPPQGFGRVLAEDGTPAGAIVPRAGLDAGDTAVPVDVEAIAEAVAAKLAAKYTSAPSSDRKGPASGPIAAPVVARPVLRNAKAVENKAWELFNTDGRINAGSYLVGAVRNTRAGAETLVENALFAEHEAAQAAGREPALLTIDEIIVATDTLTRQLLWAADQVQAHIVGKRDRAARSHNEAGKWVHQMASRHYPLTREMLGETSEITSARNEWLAQVVTAATSQFENAMAIVAEYADEEYTTPAPPSDASREGARQAARQNRPVDPKPAPSQDPNPSAAASAPATSFAADNAELIQRWIALLTTVKLISCRDKVEPLLTKMFDTADLAAINAAAFHKLVTAWEAKPDAFIKVAQQAYTQAQRHLQSA
ncbi:MAG: hypothetical protein WA988_10835 [Candidatus Nanopelagicales bacterium]